MRFKIDWANLIVRSKFTTFALFYFAFEGNFQVQASLLEGRFNGGFFPYEFMGLISGGAYFRNFTVYVRRSKYFLEFLSLKDG